MSSYCDLVVVDALLELDVKEFMFAVGRLRALSACPDRIKNFRKWVVRHFQYVSLRISKSAVDMIVPIRCEWFVGCDWVESVLTVGIRLFVGMSGDVGDFMVGGVWGLLV